MSNIKKHQCPSCGGNLTVDNDKQMYHCSFCGSTYEYEYFREDQMHEMGDTYLSRGEFAAAVDAYKFTLKKDPHDFLALRGLMLAAARLKDMDDLISEKNSKGFLFNANLVSEAVDGAAEKDKGYFEELAKIYFEMRDLSKCNAEIKSLYKERKRIGDDLRFTGETRDNYKITSGYFAKKDPTSVFIILWVIDFILLLTMICLVVPLVVSGILNTALFVGFSFAFIIGLIAVINLTGIYPEVKELKELDDYCKDLSSESGMIDAKIRKLEAESEERLAGIRASANSFVEKDRLILTEL